ncbi:hypothetical protein [Nibricoccus sp. IMCC34717]|uniref:hypothetical protein n=1 Tax=Nibricoccus sp. IMCC34717 TaxID=3034021 RepID=UPI00384CC299
MYPVTWVFALLPGALDPDWLEMKIMLHFAFAFAFFVVLARHNRISNAASLVGAACFAFSGSVAARAPAQPNIFESLVYLPLVIYGCQRAVESVYLGWRNPWVGFAAFVTALMILAGHMQPAVHTGFAVVILTILMSWRSPWKLAGQFLTLAAIGVVAAMLAGPQIAALLEYMEVSYRWIGAAEPTAPPHRIPYEVYGYHYVSKWSDLRGLWDNAYPSKDGATLFLTKTGLLLAGIGLVIGRGLFLRFATAISLLAFLISMGDGSWLGKAAYHLPLLGAIREPSRILCLFHLGAAILIAGGVDSILKIEGKRRAIKVATVVLFGFLTIIELAGHARTLIPPRTMKMYPGNYYSDFWATELARRTQYNPEGPFRYMALPNELLPPNLGNTAGAMSTRGHRATMQMNYLQFLNRDWKPGGETFHRLGLRFIVSREPIPNFIKVLEYDGLGLWERPDALPIFHFVSNIGYTAAPIEKVKWNSNSVDIELGEHPAIRMIFAQVPFPGWHVKIDGNEAKLIDHDGLLAVDIDQNTCNVSFIYQPKWLVPLSALTILALLLIATSLIRERHNL